MLKSEISINEIADWLVDVLDNDGSLRSGHPMDDIDWQRRRVAVEQARRTGDLVTLRWMASDYSGDPGYKREWAW